MPTEYADLEAYEETYDFLGKPWREIELCAYETNSCVFTFLPPDALPYYFGAYLYKSVEQKEFWAMAFDRSSDATSFREICKLLTTEQMCSVVDCLVYWEKHIEDENRNIVTEQIEIAKEIATELFG